VAIARERRQIMKPSAPPHMAPTISVPEPTPNSLPPTARKQVYAVVRGDAMDAEVVKMACIFARAKQAQLVALYGIEVPRKNELEAPMPTEEAQAERALQFATTVAERYDSDIETEMVKTRKFALSVVEEVNRCQSCSMLVLGVPYTACSDGTAQMDGDTTYILEHAMSRVVLIRGSNDAQA
jgi:K+-sensing histidine kinase KdpD